MATSRPVFPPAADGPPTWALPLLDVLDTAAWGGTLVEGVAVPDTVASAEMARKSGVSCATISRRIAAGDIETPQVGNRPRIPVRGLDRYRRSLAAS